MDTQAPQPAPQDRQSILGRMALERGFISPAQYEEALEAQDRAAAAGNLPAPSLGAILVDKGYLTDIQRNNLLTLQETYQGDHVQDGPTPFGKYFLVRVIGRGAMGVVHEGVDNALQRPVAIKLMQVFPHDDPVRVKEEEERFIREARFAAKLDSHPNIVGVHDAGVIDGRRFIAMDYIEGASFGEWRRKQLPPLARQVEILREVSLAVQHAHDRDVIHRDLKPNNILVDTQGKAFVTDFGLARMAASGNQASLTATGMVVGTPSYMSPEQASGVKSLDGRTDIYALGAILYEVLTDRTPFDGESPMDILMNVVNRPVKPPSTVAKAVDPRLEAVCMKALSKDPAERYETAKDLADDLASWSAGSTVRAAPVPKSRKSPVPILVGAAVVALAVAIAVLVSGHSADEPPPRFVFAEEWSASPRAVNAVEFSPDGKRLAAGSADGTVQVWTLPDRPDPVILGPHQGKVESLGFSPDGNHLVVVTELEDNADAPGEIRVWNPVSGAVTRVLEGHEKAVYTVALPASGDLLATGGADALVLLWNRSSGKVEQELKGHEYAVRGMAILPDGGRMVSAGWDDRMILWDLESGSALETFSGHAEGIWGLALSPDGRTVATAAGDKTVRLWDVAERKELAILRGHGEGVQCVAFSPDGRILASGARDRTVRLWDVATRRLLDTLAGHGEAVWTLAFSPDGGLLASGSFDGSIRLWKRGP